MRTAKWMLLVAVGVATMGAGPACGVEMEKGPAYLTDSHGASGVVHGLLELTKVAPEYDKYWKGALDWLIAVAQRDEQGRLTWMMSTTAPKGHPSWRISIPGMCHVIRMFLAGYERCGEKKYKEAALAGVRSLTERFARKKKTEYGTAYHWSHAYREGDRSDGVLAGHSHGLGNLLDTLVDAYKVSPRKDLREALAGILINLRLRGRRMDKGGEAVIAWPTLKNRNIYETGYCYGQAGVTVALLNLSEVLPDLRLSDGTTALSLANANLRYLMGVARKEGEGYVWPHMRHDKTSRNVGLGSGTGGIGWAFLRGAEVNRKADPAFATRCTAHARGAVVYAVDLALRHTAKGARAMPGPGGDVGFGVCGGAGGAGMLMKLYAQQAGSEDAELVAKSKTAVERIARCVIASAVEVDGTLACPDRTHFKRVNLALDYGQTGVVLGLAATGQYLQSDEFIAAAKKVADYIVRRAVPEAGGFKYAQFHPIPK